MFALVKRWVTFTISMSFALLLLFSLVTYNPYTPSLLYDTTEVSSALGGIEYMQARIAGFLLYFLGSSALLLSIMFGLYAMRCLWPRGSIKKSHIGTLLVSIPLCSTIAHRYSFELFTCVCPGGAVGTVGSRMLFALLDEKMADMFLFIALWSMLIVLMQFSWIVYLAPLLSFCMYGLKKVQALVSYGYEKVRAYSARILPGLSDKDTQESTIYEDPFWGTYINPAYSIQVEKKVVPLVEKRVEKDETPEQLRRGYKLPHPEGKVIKESSVDKAAQAESEQQARALEHKLERFGIEGKVVAITHGPVVTLFEYQPSIDTKISTICAREDDLALALQALSLRIIAPIPGRSVIGFEVAHSKRRAELFSELIRSDHFVHFKGSLPLILGKDTLGANVVIDLATMPHLLVAGSTGSGKSVGLHAMFMSLLCSKTPQEMRCILIDPKRLEFSSYTDCAHLLFPIITDPARALTALRWAVKAMEDRYTLMATKGVRNIIEYNASVEEKNEELLPFIVIIIDELADLMMTAGKDIEHLIARLAQMARAAGIHMITATQRPSVDVITGLIKVNFPSRVAFKVTSKVDSRTIIDMTGAEKLLGKGDMLFLDTKGSLSRVHGAYVTEEEIMAVVKHIKAQQTVEYIPLTTTTVQEEECDDDLYEEVLSFISQKNEVSISLLQRAFRIGYNRSARLIDQLESQGYIMPHDGSKMRKVVKELVENNNFSNKI